jgi:hypothetical protein
MAPHNELISVALLWLVCRPYYCLVGLAGSVQSQNGHARWLSFLSYTRLQTCHKSAIRLRLMPFKTNNKRWTRVGSQQLTTQSPDTKFLTTVTFSAILLRRSRLVHELHCRTWRQTNNFRCWLLTSLNCTLPASPSSATDEYAASGWMKSWQRHIFSLRKNDPMSLLVVVFAPPATERQAGGEPESPIAAKQRTGSLAWRYTGSVTNTT